MLKLAGTSPNPVRAIANSFNSNSILTIIRFVLSLITTSIQFDPPLLFE